MTWIGTADPTLQCEQAPDRFGVDSINAQKPRDGIALC